MKILVVEDDRRLAEFLDETLESAGFVVEVAHDGERADFLGCTEIYDAMVLDLGLPKLDGLTVLQNWRNADQHAPVLILTARGRWSEKLAGFNAGANDYLTKPFEMEEVVVRLRALIRRNAGHATVELKCGPLALDTMSGRVTDDGMPLKLTALEFRVVSYLMHHQNKVISRTELMEHVYGDDSDPDSNVIDVIIGRIRRKLTENMITTVRGRGFRLDAPR